MEGTVMFTLYMTLLWTTNVVQFNLPGFGSQHDCEAYGRAWFAQVQAEQRENPTKIPRWECVKKE